MKNEADPIMPPTVIAPKLGTKKLALRLIPLFILVVGLAVGLIALRARLSTKPKASETIAKVWFGNGAFGPASVTTTETEFTVRITISVPDGQKIGFARAMLQLPASVSVAFDAATIPAQYELVSDSATQLDREATLVVRIKPDSMDIATQVLSVNAVVTLPSAGFAGDITLYQPPSTTEVYSQAVGLDPAQNYVNEAINSSDTNAGVLHINPADVSPTPTPTPPACGKGLHCSSAPLVGSAPCSDMYGTTNCCPSGETIIGGYCSGSTPSTPPPPACGTSLHCSSAPLVGSAPCSATSGTIINCCPSGETIIGGYCSGSITQTPTPTPTPQPTPTPTPINTPTPTGIVTLTSMTFTVHLQGITTKGRDQHISLKLEQNGEVVEEYDDVAVVSDNSGNYSGTISGFSAGVYDVIVKAPSHLAKKVATNVTLDGSVKNWADVTHEPMAGDVNGDNKITLVDITGISSARGDQLIVPITDAITKYDVNGDSSITVQDLALAIMNWANYADENMEVVGD